jgi:hypothetical protein
MFSTERTVLNEILKHANHLKKLKDGVKTQNA